MFAETRRFSSPSGALLAYHHQDADGDARAILLVCHGLIEHSRRYEAFAVAMAERGLHVYAHDHRGHGETLATEAPLGRFADRDGAQKVVDDVLAMREMARDENPGLPVILFGHSMGGLIALNAAISHPDAFDALAIWNSNLNPGLSGRFAQLVLAIERMLKGSDVPSAILPKATFATWAKSIPARRTDFDWLSHDPVEVDTYAADPLCRFDASVSLWIDVFALTFRGKNLLSHLKPEMPINLVGGGEDPATNRGRAILWLQQRLAQLGFRRVTVKIYPEMRHESLNEIGREQAISDFADWCDTVLPRAPEKLSA
ncbi:MAG: alpha/beta fold hydrolase [Allorhizobium sp.]